MRGDQNKRLTILSEAEKIALYGLPDFDDFQRIEFFAMTDAEHALAFARKGLAAQLYCLLQIGYFKAKQAFFRFSLDDAPTEDIAFLMQRYFPGQALPTQQLSDNDDSGHAKRLPLCLVIVSGLTKTCRCCSIRQYCWPERTCLPLSCWPS